MSTAHPQAAQHPDRSTSTDTSTTSSTSGAPAVTTAAATAADANPAGTAANPASSAAARAIAGVGPAPAPASAPASAPALASARSGGGWAAVVGELRVAWEVPVWVWRFYLRNLPLVVGLSLVPSVQRLVAVNGWLPDGLALASEVVVALTRLVLVVAVARIAFRGMRVRWAAFREFAAAHWPSLVWQGVLLTVAFLLFDVVLESVVGGLLPEGARQGYLAVLLFVKNPTVIALTFIWWVGLVRRTAGVAEVRR